MSRFGGELPDRDFHPARCDELCSARNGAKLRRSSFGTHTFAGGIKRMSLIAALCSVKLVV